MLDVALYSRGRPWAAPWLDAFALGLERHGIKASIEDAATPRDCDLAVFWGHREAAIIERQRTNGGHYLVAECSYLADRLAMVSLGFDGLNGRADFVNADVPGDRWERHFAPLMAPAWRTEGTGWYVLLCGQVATDQAVAHVDIAAWYAETAQRLQGLGYRVRFRPHPKSRGGVNLPGVEISIASLADDLAGAAFAVTFNSNSAVDAALAGVPVIACDPGSMAWAIAGHDVGEAPPRLMRRTWAHRLAYCQWNDDEVRGGDAWAHLKRKFED